MSDKVIPCAPRRRAASKGCVQPLAHHFSEVAELTSAAESKSQSFCEIAKISVNITPPSVNHYWVRTKRGFFVSKEGQDFKKAIAIAAHGIKPFCGDVALKIEFVPSDRRKRDIDNIAKCVLDSLKGIVYNDDSQVVHLEMWKKEPQKEPRLSIECYQIGLI